MVCAAGWTDRRCPSLSRAASRLNPRRASPPAASAIKGLPLRPQILQQPVRSDSLCGGPGTGAQEQNALPRGNSSLGPRAPPSTRASGSGVWHWHDRLRGLPGRAAEAHARPPDGRIRTGSRTSSLLSGKRRHQSRASSDPSGFGSPSQKLHTNYRRHIFLLLYLLCIIYCTMHSAYARPAVPDHDCSMPAAKRGGAGAG